MTDTAQTPVDLLALCDQFMRGGHRWRVQHALAGFGFRNDLGRQHDRHAALFADAALDCGDRRRGRVAGHRAGVAEREVDVRVPVDILDPCAAGRGRVHRVPADPLGHPRHRHLAEQVSGLLVGLRVVMEVARTDSHHYRHLLVERLDFVERLVERLAQGPIPDASGTP